MAIGLPFGWAPAPGIFTKFMKEFIKVFRNPKLISNGDWLIKR